MKKKILCLLFLFVSIIDVMADNAINNKKEDYYFPYISGNILGEYNFTRLDSNEYGNKLYNDKNNLAFLQIESNLNIYFFRNFYLKTGAVFRPVMNRLNKDSYSDNDYYGLEDYFKRKSYFSKYDIIFEELAFEYKEEQFLFGAGKFNPTFGTAYDKSKYYPVLGTKIAEQYELTEKLGFYIAMTLPMLTLRGNFFYNDDTFLSRSVFGNRVSYKDKRNVGNDNKLNNFSITADIAINDYKINLGLKKLNADNKNNNRAEKGYVIGFEKLIEETNDSFGFLPFIEYSFIENYNGENNRNLNYLTARLPFVYKNWNIIAAYSARFDQEDHFKDYKSYLAQIGIGYKFNNGLMIDASKSIERESYKISATEKTSFKNNSYGIRLSYMLMLDSK